MKTVNKLFILLTGVIMTTLPFGLEAQNVGKDFFVLYEGGKRFLKPKKYLLLSEDATQVKDEGKIIFYIGKQRFIHKPAEHRLDTCPESYFNSLRLSKVDQLFIDEKNEFDRAKKQEQYFNAIPPVGHYILKVFIVRAINKEKYMFFEVEWENSIP